MIMNDLAEIHLESVRGLEDWEVELLRYPEDLIFPWRVVIKDPSGQKYTDKGGTPGEAFRNAKYQAGV